MAAGTTTNRDAIALQVRVIQEQAAALLVAVDRELDTKGRRASGDSPGGVYTMSFTNASACATAIATAKTAIDAAITALGT